MSGRYKNALHIDSIAKDLQDDIKENADGQKLGDFKDDVLDQHSQDFIYDKDSADALNGYKGNGSDYVEGALGVLQMELDGNNAEMAGGISDQGLTDPAELANGGYQTLYDSVLADAAKQAGLNNSSKLDKANTAKLYRAAGTVKHTDLEDAYTADEIDAANRQAQAKKPKLTPLPSADTTTIRGGSGLNSPQLG